MQYICKCLPAPPRTPPGGARLPRADVKLGAGARALGVARPHGKVMQHDGGCHGHVQAGSAGAVLRDVHQRVAGRQFVGRQPGALSGSDHEGLVLRLCMEGAPAARQRTSLPSMKAVGPQKGCECTGRALGPTSTPTTLQPAEHADRFRPLSVMCQVRQPRKAGSQHIPRSVRRKQQHCVSVLKCRSWMWSMAPWLPKALNFLEPTRHIWRSTGVLSACCCYSLSTAGLKLQPATARQQVHGAHLCHAKRRGTACYHAKVVSLAYVVYDDIARRRTALLAPGLALSGRGRRMLLMVAVLAGVLHLSAHAVPVAGAMPATSRRSAGSQAPVSCESA